MFSSTPMKAVQNKAKKSDGKVVMFNCNNCNYECKKEKRLKKHIITKHEYHMCKECEENLPTFLDFIKHIAEHHCTELKDLNDMKDQSKTEVDEKEDEEKSTKANSFVFSESMMDEFIQ